jgi:hypothetical protein
MSEPRRITLMTYRVLVEAQLAKNHLQGAGIEAVVLGEHSAAVDPRLGMAGGIRLQVWESDARRAEEVLTEESVPLGTTDGQGVPEGAVCPVHEVPATVVCARCGGFNCVRCPTFGSPALCEDCVEHESPAAPAREGQRLWVKGVAAMLLLPGALAFSLMALALLLRALGLWGR